MIYLRPLTIKDANRLFQIKSNPHNFNKKFTNFDTDNITLMGINKFLKNIINEIDAIRLGICIKKDNILIGSITLGNINYNSSCCELHIYIDIKYQGVGYGKSSLKCVLNYINYVLNLNTVTLKVHKEHGKAINLYKKIGFNISSDEDDKYDFLNMYLTH
jgi:RimJ/RimL family protein N-acetyltransferase